MGYRIGVLGLGKLGLPFSVALASKFKVLGFDSDPAKRQYRQYEHKELGPTLNNDFQDYFQKACTVITPNSGLEFALSIGDMVANSDIIFVAVQTPHEETYDGSKLLPPWPDRKDFDYTYLRLACKELAN